MSSVQYTSWCIISLLNFTYHQYTRWSIVSRWCIISLLDSKWYYCSILYLNALGHLFRCYLPRHSAISRVDGFMYHQDFVFIGWRLQIHHHTTTLQCTNIQLDSNRSSCNFTAQRDNHTLWRWINFADFTQHHLQPHTQTHLNIRIHTRVTSNIHP